MCCNENAELHLTLLDFPPDSIMDSGDMPTEESLPKPKKGKKKKKPPSFALLDDDDDNDNDDDRDRDDIGIIKKRTITRSMYSIVCLSL